MTAFLLSKNITNLLSYLGECAAIICFSNHLKAKSERRHTCLAFLSLAMLSFLYFQPASFNVAPVDYSLGSLLRQFSRMSLHLLAVFGYTLFNRDTAWEKALYWASFFTVIYLTFQNARNAAVLLVQPIGVISVYRQIISYVFVVLELAIVMLICRFVDFPSVRKIHGGRWSFVAVALMLEVYIKWSLITIGAQQLLYDRAYDLICFAFLSGTGVLFILVLYETNLERQKKAAAADAENLRMAFEMQNVKRSLQANNDIRRLYHDMKNHLLAMQSIAEDTSALKNYLSDLLNQFRDYEIQVSTGNTTIDAILSEKIQRASTEHILFNVVLDLQDLSFVKTVDLVTILGNAVDNAVEAVRKMSDDQKRFIYIKSNQFANMKIIRISNQFNDEIKRENENFPTSKPDAHMHGIGLKSIQRATERYGGFASVGYDNAEKWFRLVIMIPTDHTP